MRMRATWNVVAGIIPGEPSPEYSKSFVYTSADYEEDQKITQYQEHAKFAKIRAEAMDYFLQMNNPKLLNWASISFIWY